MEWIIILLIIYILIPRRQDTIIIEREDENETYNLTIVIVHNDSDGTISEQDVLRTKWERGRTIDHE